MKTALNLIVLIVLFTNSHAQTCNVWIVTEQLPQGNVQLFSQVGLGGFFWEQDYEIFYQWDFGDGQTSVEDNPIHEYATSGMYEVSVMIEVWLNGEMECADSASELVEIVTVEDECEALFEYALSEDGSITTTNLSTNNMGEASYLWFFNGDQGWVNTFEGSYQYRVSGGFEVCLLSSVYEGTNEICNSRSCQVVQVDLPEPDCPAGEYPLTAQINTIAEAPSGSGDDLYISIYNEDTFNLVAQDAWRMSGPPSVYTRDFCVPEGCFDIQLDVGVNDTDYLGTLFFSSPNLSSIDSSSVYGCCAYNYSLCIQGDETACESSISSSLIDGTCFQFEMDGWVNADSVLWNFGGEEWIVGSYIQSHCFPESLDPNIYLVSAIGYGSFCEEGSISELFIEVPAFESNPFNCAFTWDVSIDSNGLASYNIDTEQDDYDLLPGQEIMIQWYFGDGGYSNEWNPTYQYSLPGEYTVCLTMVLVDGVSPQCLNEQCQNVMVDFTISNVLESSIPSLAIFPNPTDGTLNIAMPEGFKIDRIELFDSTGRMLLNTSFTTLIDLSSFSDGIYFLRAHTGKGTLQSRLVLER
jgi:PKD repeat protein